MVAAVEREDEDGFHAAFEELLHFVRAEGEPLGDEDLEPSDVILPPADLTLRRGRRGVQRRGADPRPRAAQRGVARPPECRRAVRRRGGGSAPRRGRAGRRERPGDRRARARRDDSAVLGEPDLRAAGLGLVRERPVGAVVAAHGAKR